jgi:hypothetical protein
MSSQCGACLRAEPGRPLFCQDCISQRFVLMTDLRRRHKRRNDAERSHERRLAEHHARRQQLRNALTLVTSKAAALLTGTERPATTLGAGRGAALGVEEERLLKAEKWKLASRAYAAREAVAKGKTANESREFRLSRLACSMRTRLLRCRTRDSRCPKSGDRISPRQLVDRQIASLVSRLGSPDNFVTVPTSLSTSSRGPARVSCFSQ